MSGSARDLAGHRGRCPGPGAGRGLLTLPHVTQAEVPDAVRGAFAGLPRVLRRHGRAVVHRTGTPERHIPRNRVSSRAHGFGDPSPGRKLLNITLRDRRWLARRSASVTGCQCLEAVLRLQADPRSAAVTGELRSTGSPGHRSRAGQSARSRFPGISARLAGGEGRACRVRLRRARTGPRTGSWSPTARTSGPGRDCGGCPARPGQTGFP